MMRLKLIPLFLSVILILSACVSDPKVQRRIVTVPPGAELIVNGRNIGPSPMTLPIDTSTTFELEIQAKKDGYFTEVTRRGVGGSNTPAMDITIALQKSPMWEATTPSAALNEWLILLVNDDLAPANVWNSLINLISEQYSGIREISYQLGSAESNAIEKHFQTVRGDISLRSKMRVTRPSERPLTYKIRIVTEWSQGAEWQPYDRVFVEDEQLIQALFERFGG